ncbi:MAG: DegV family protein [Oscillospiraceae bacterium]|jgi:DegV family protein with EDD domain|nr:DegV family protein [Oscillospiraceae bacterium]
MSDFSYTLMTDSTCDLTPEYLRSVNVPAIALSYTINGETHFDGNYEGAATIESFYELQRQGQRATTSQISSTQYIEGMSPYLEKGDLIYLCFSSALSGSYASACVAGEELRLKYPNRTLYIIDTRAASLGEGLLVMHAVQKRDDGLSIHELKEWVELNWRNYCHIVTVDNLHHLRMGGRISAATEFIGSIFDIKPMIYLNLEGKLIPDGKARGRKRSLDKLVAQTKADIVNPEEQILTICHGDCLADAKYVRERLIKEVGVKDVLIGYTGTVIGSHTGPGVLAVFFVGNNRK